MAGDWIKLEAVTPDKPEIHGISERLGCSHGDAFLACVRLWIWADEQSLKGNAMRVTRTTIDRIGGMQRFADALEDVGWLIEENGGATLPNFDRHNGKTAKARALTAKRVATHKLRRANAEVTRGALPREEKRYITPISPSAPFLLFWSAWPQHIRKQSRGTCYRLWRQRGYDKAVDAIVAHVEAMKRSGEWTKEDGKYCPAPLVYLRQQRWDGAEAVARKQPENRVAMP